MAENIVLNAGVGVRKEMTKKSPLTELVDIAITIEKLRISTEVRLTNLTKQERYDFETRELHQKLKELEHYIDKRVAAIISDHPAYPWFSLVKGIGKENIAKVVALIDINKAPTISSLWMFAGFAPGEDGKSMKRIKGQQLQYNSQLRAMCWRLGSSLKRATGSFYNYYVNEKRAYNNRFLAQGYKILPTPKDKWSCLNCGTGWARKQDIIPCCARPIIEKSIRHEPPGVLWLGHLDMMATRKMIKLFLACLWLVWRQAEGLSTTKPYPLEKLDYKILISPWEMIDKLPTISERAKRPKEPIINERF